MLTRRIILTPIALLGVCLPFAQAAAIEDQVRQAEKSWATAVTSGDQAALGRMLADQLIYAHSTGIVDTKADYLGKMRSGDQKYEGIEHQNMTISSYGDSAVVHSTVRMTGKTKGQPFDNKLMMLHLWVKQGGRWQLAAHQTTRLP